MSYYFFRLLDPNNAFSSQMGSKSSSGGSKEDYIIQMEAENGAHVLVDADHTFHPQDAVWHCTECGVTRTPLWRIGPQGPKTLCNACGLRYRKRMQVDTTLSLGSLNSKMPGRRSSSRR